MSLAGVGCPVMVGGVDTIVISDLEVFYRVGVPDTERARAQRLLVTVEMQQDFSAAVATDSVEKTIDYWAVSQALLKFGEGREWRLIERLAADVAGMIISKFRAASVSVEVKKFVIPEAQFVSVRIERSG